MIEHQAAPLADEPSVGDDARQYEPPSVDVIGSIEELTLITETDLGPDQNGSKPV